MPRRKSRPRKAARKKKTWILCLEKDDPEKELDFEVRWQLSLSRKERFDMMFERSRQVRGMLRRHGHSTPPTIVKRTSG